MKTPKIRHFKYWSTWSLKVTIGRLGNCVWVQAHIGTSDEGHHTRNARLYLRGGIPCNSRQKTDGLIAFLNEEGLDEFLVALELARAWMKEMSAQ